MRRRSFLLAAGAAAIAPVWKGTADPSLGTLAWVDAGSLWIRELPDGRAVKVVSGETLHTPRFSSTGRWLSYRSRDDRLSVVRSDGQSGASFEAESGAWFPHEDRLAVKKSEGDDVTVYAAESDWKSPVALWKDATLPVFAPDGERFVFGNNSGSVPEKDGDAPFVGQICLASLSAPKRKPEVLVSNEGGEVQPYGWTRDGKYVVYWGAGEVSASLWCDGMDLYSVAVDGGQARKLGVSVLVHEDTLAFAPESAGNRLAVTSGDGREAWAGKRIAVVDLDAGPVRNLTVADVAALCPAWSPDGQRIAYVAGPDADVAYKKSMAGVNIRIMRPDGATETKVVTPDMRIGVGGGEEAHRFLQQRKIWLLDPSGAVKPRQLTTDPRYRDEVPLWSAGGTHILFGRMDYEGQMSLWLMESSGGALARLCGLQIFDDLGTQDSWFGFYGYTDWRDAFDWRR